ncbi:Uncharacterised protein [uncultured archaeon]|nr:Uncharacterised protein [uncultured archaeon]
MSKFVFVVLVFLLFVAGCLSNTETSTSSTVFGEVSSTVPSVSSTVVIEQSSTSIFVQTTTTVTVPVEAVFQLRTYGGFINPARANRELIVNSSTVVYRVLSADGVLQEEYLKAVDLAVYNRLLTLFSTSGFESMKDAYRRQGSNVPDVGTTEISYIQDGRTKTVKSGPFLSNDTEPQGFMDLAEALTSLMPAETVVVPSVTLSYQPMQCVDTPWDAWYAEGKIQFIKEPTDKQLATAYYANQYNLTLLDFTRNETGQITCMACGVCPTSYYFEATVSGGDEAVLLALNWTKHLGAGESAETPSVEKPEDYNPAVNPKNFLPKVTAQLYPMPPGRTLVYTGTSFGLQIRKEISATNNTKTILGVTTTEVVTRTFVYNTTVADEVFRYIAQDTQNNVWLFGEEVKQGGKSSWTAGVDGAKPGLIIRGNPRVGHFWRQAYLKNVIEDVTEVLSINEYVSVPGGSYHKCVKTQEWTPLQQDVNHFNYYCPGAGPALLQTNQGQEYLKLKEIIR